MQHFFNMGGYARYVWPSYALALLAVVLNIYWARRSLRDAQSQARRRLERTGESDAIKKGAL